MGFGVVWEILLPLNLCTVKPIIIPYLDRKSVV